MNDQNKEPVYDTHDCDATCPHNGFTEILADFGLGLLIVLFFIGDLSRKFLDLDPIRKFVVVWVIGCGIMTGVGIYYLFFDN